MTWCVRDGRTAENPLSAVPKFEEQTDKRRERRALTPAELGRLLAAARARDVETKGRWGSRELVYTLAAYSGLRRGEMKLLEWRDVDLEQSVVTVRAEVSKSKRDDMVPLHPKVVKLLRQVRPDDPAPRGRVLSSLPTIRTVYQDFERAGIPKVDKAGRVVDLHALRTTLGTELAKNGVAPQVAQKIMRHADYRTTMAHYTKLGLQDAAAAIDELPELPE